MRCTGLPPWPASSSLSCRAAENWTKSTTSTGSPPPSATWSSDRAGPLTGATGPLRHRHPDRPQDAFRGRDQLVDGVAVGRRGDPGEQVHVAVLDPAALLRLEDVRAVLELQVDPVRPVDEEQLEVRDAGP